MREAVIAAKANTAINAALRGIIRNAEGEGRQERHDKLVAEVAAAEAVKAEALRQKAERLERHYQRRENEPAQRGGDNPAPGRKRKRSVPSSTR